MLWQFGELGYDFSIDFNGRVGNKPIRWDYWDDPDRRSLYDAFAALIRLRNESDAFTNPSAQFFDFTSTTSDPTKAVNLTGSDTEVYIVGNFGVETTTRTANFTQTGNWFDFFTGLPMDVSDVNMQLELGPGEFKIYTTKQFFTPADGIFVSNEDEDRIANDVPTVFALNQNYPNPFNPSTTISYDLDRTSEVTLEIFDSLGRRVATLVNGNTQQAGSYNLSYDASNLASGIYLIRLATQTNVQIRKMTLIK